MKLFRSVSHTALAAKRQASPLWTFGGVFCLALFAGSFLAGCSDDGTTLQKPSSDLTTTTRPAPPTSAPDVLESKQGLRLNSADFEPGGPAPLHTTCEGQNRFPALEWSPSSTEGATEIAISLTDQSNSESPVLLWLVVGVDPSTVSLDSDTLPSEARETLNDFGTSGYGNPCVDSRGAGARLQFRLHILERASEVGADTAGNEAFEKIQALTVESAAIVMTIDAGPIGEQLDTKPE